MSSDRATTRVQAKLDLFGVLEGHYAVEILLQLHKLGILKLLAKPITVSQLARQERLNCLLLDQLLQFLCRSTNLLKYSKGWYSLKLAPAQLFFQLEKFSCAYAPSLRSIGRALKEKGTPVIDSSALARAFASFDDGAKPVVALARKAGVRQMVDLGCGPAWLLVALGSEDPEFHAFGLERNQEMCSLARNNVRQAHLGSRIQIKRGDARHPEKLLSSAQLSAIEAVHGGSFLNEFFSEGESGAIEVLQHLRRQFPGRIAWFVDYYSALGSRDRRVSRPRLTLLQDVAQVASLQGVPPSRLQDWERIYRKSGCHLAEVHEFQNDEITWFAHTIQF
jgi:SAM-dependent methyltransferase